MDIVKEIYLYIVANWYGILIAGSALLTAAELIVRLTPTKKDDGFVERVGKFYRKLLDLAKVPNVKRKNGSIIMPDGVHRKKSGKSS